VTSGELEQGIPVPELFCRAGLCVSRSEARRLIKQWGLYMNHKAVMAIETLVTHADLLDSGIILGRGRKRRQVYKRGRWIAVEGT